MRLGPAGDGMKTAVQGPRRSANILVGIGAVGGAAQLSTSRQTGTVRSFVRLTGYGFIVSDAGNRDVFLHEADLLDGRVPLRGDRVEFRLSRDPNGKHRAREARVLGK